ncbi:MAG: hypothetical protein GXY83_34315 [Rhodopirellula sp.]|nr:hypothetical protein [Rhodopirellula sp.]
MASRRQILVALAVCAWLPAAQAQEFRVGPVRSAVAPSAAPMQPDQAAAMVQPSTAQPGEKAGQPEKVSPPGGPPSRPDGSAAPGGGDSKAADAEKTPPTAEKKPEAGGGSGPAAVQRPTSPPEPGDPEQLKVRPDEEGKIRFNFTNQKWLDVLEWLADIAHLSLDWQDLPGDYLNLVTAEKYSLDEARDLINRHLLARGYTLLRRGEVMSVVKLDKLNPAMVPWVEPGELDRRDPHEFVKVTFALDWLLAEAAAEELKPMISQYGKLNALKSTNRLEAMDTVVNLMEVRRLLAEEQSDTGEGRLVIAFPLKHTRAEEVRKLLMQLLGIEEKPKGGSPGQPQPGQPGQPQPQSHRPDQQPQGKPEKKEAVVNIVADERTNTIYVHAPPDKIAVVRQAIESIDAPTGRTEMLAQNITRMKVYRLESLDPEPVLKTLEELGGLSVDARLKIDKENKAIVAYASLADHVILASVIEKLDGGARHSAVVQLTDLRAESVARVVNTMMGGGPEEDGSERSDQEEAFNPFFFPSRSSSQRKRVEKHEDRFRVDADVKNNRLLLWCNDFELAKVEDLLENLRAGRPTGDEERLLEVHRLVSLDPEPLVKTLVELETLGAGVQLEADKQNRAILAFATEADHARIRVLIAQLDGSGRQFHVVPLRRLEADYVAGTVAFMMAGKGDDEGSSGRSYRYSYYERRYSRDEQKKEDVFRVDADVEFNRLLVWANDIEMAEVQNLLVKLGEAPPEGGDSRSFRILDIPPGPERDRLLDQLRRTWPSLAPNPLLLPETAPPEEEKRADPPEQKVDATSGKTTAKEDGASQFRFVAEAAKEGMVPKRGLAPSQAALHPPETHPGEVPVPVLEPRPKDAAAGPPPVRVGASADGRLMLSSQDTKALDQIEALIAEIAPSRRDYEIIQLKYAEAYWVALTLEDFFEEKKSKDSGSNDYGMGWWGYPPPSSSENDTRRLSRRRPLKFISDDTTNTILVQGATPNQLRTIGDLVEIYDRPAMSDSDSARKTEILPIRFAKAATVAEAIKDVYRDLLSENDKALLSAKKKDDERQESRYTYVYSFGNEQDRDLERKPRFKGYLSLGVDEVSNALVVSAPEFLFRDISRLVEELDEAARPAADAIYVHRLSGGVDRNDLRRRLSKILEGEGVRAGAASQKEAGGEAATNTERPKAKEE